MAVKCVPAFHAAASALSHPTMRPSLLIDIDVGYRLRDLINPSSSLYGCLKPFEWPVINNKGVIAMLAANECTGGTGLYVLTPAQ
jgi:hypothetical protein